MSKFFQRRVGKLKHRAVETVAPSSVRRALPRWGDFKKALRPARPDRAVEELMAADFPLLLKKWGIEPFEVPTVIKGLTLEGGVYLLVALALCVLTLIAASHGDIIWALVTLVWVFAAGAAVLTRMWRRSILKHKHFCTFKQWLGF